MKPVRSFRVASAFPDPIKRLKDLAYNLRWTWNHDTIELFRRLDSLGTPSVSGLVTWAEPREASK